jgi:hypothetical protein
MHRIIGVLALLAAAAALAGCLETRDEFSLNPDGSGKVVINMTMPDRMAVKTDAMSFALSANLRPAPEAEPAAVARRTLRQLLDGSKGVEAWSDLDCGADADGHIRIKATAYFKDLAAFQPDMPMFFTGMKWAKDDHDGWVLQANLARPAAVEVKPPAGDVKPAAEPPSLTDPEIDDRIKTQREAYQLIRPVAEKILASFTVDVAFRLPGNVTDVSGFTQEAFSAVRVVMDGPQVLRAMDQVMADDAALREAVRQGRDVAKDGPLGSTTLGDKLMAGKGPLRVRVTGDAKPLFDYSAEVKAAQEAYPKALEKLGLDKLAAEPPAPATPVSGAENGAETMKSEN